MDSPPPVLEKTRYHDLDALRAFAMLLGIVLHGVLSFFPIPMDIWPAQDLQQPALEVPASVAKPLEESGLPVPAQVSPFEFLLHAIHGFRMQLFFLVSGFFTAMLWRNRGLKQLAKHRAKRILLPLAIALPLIWGAIIPVAIYGDAKKKEVDALRNQSAQTLQPQATPDTSGEAQSLTTDIIEAAIQGDLRAIEKHIQAGTDLNQRGMDKATPLIAATTFGRVEVVKALIDAGADLNLKDKDGSTALLGAAFFGHIEIVEALLDAGADPNIKNKHDATALDVVQLPWGQIKPFYDIVGASLAPLGLELDYQRIQETRPAITALLKEHGAEGTDAGLAGLILLLFFFPVFHHLWFLYYLAWLVIGFLLITWLLGKLKWKPLPDWLITSPWRWLWMLPVTLVPQLFMPDEFGPTTAVGFLPWPPLFIYYAIFFGFGALCYGRESFENKVGKHWPVHFGLAIPVLGAGLCLYWADNHGPLLAACAVTYAWLMIFGFIGFFRHFFSGENKFIRYVSDSSYWLYIAHLPVIMLVQAWISPWDMPAGLKFLIACALTTLPLLLVYEYGVRYTFVGTLLNGKRTRTEN